MKSSSWEQLVAHSDDDPERMLLQGALTQAFHGGASCDLALATSHSS